MKKTGKLGRTMILVLLVAMMAALLPCAQAEEAQYGYLVINNNTQNRVVNFRPKPGTTDYITRLPEGLVMKITGLTTHKDTRWYQVERLSDGRDGYIHGDFLHEMTAEEVSAWQTAGTDVFPSYITPTVPQPTAVPSVPSTPADPAAGKGYIKTTKKGVNIRKAAGSDTVLTGPMKDKIPVNTVLEYYEGPVSASYEGKMYNWVLVNHQGIIGYVRSDCYTYCDADGKEVTPPAVVAPTAQPGPSPMPGQQGTVKTNVGAVNLRDDKLEFIRRIPQKGTEFPYYSYKIAPWDGKDAIWFQVYDSVTKGYGYILSDFVDVTPGTGGTAPSPTAAPVSTGYVATSIDYVWIRNAPKGDAGTNGKVQKAYTVLTQTGAKVESSPYDWYPIMTKDGTQGYIRSDCITELAQWQVDYYKANGTCPTPTPAPATPRPGNSDHLITTDGSLWVRKTPSSKSETLNTADTQLSKDYVTKFYSTEKVGSVTWYEIEYGNTYGWLHGDYVRVLSNAEYDAWQGTQPTPTPTPTPTPLPDPSNFSDLAITTTTKVKLRAKATINSKELTMFYNAYTELEYLGKYELEKSTGTYWFNVKRGNLSGWMHGDYVRVLTKEEKTMYELAGDPDAPREATYRNLSVGSTGEDVQALQDELVKQGYLAAEYATGTYQTATKEAVEAFQKDKKLTVDGVAGENTQHALFGTVPEGYYTGSTVNPVLYPVEKSDWFKGEINSIWKRGLNAIVTDVYTGISFRAQRLYGDNHVDAEPATTADTEAYCRIFKVSTPQEIEDREAELQSYKRRPLWVTIGTRTFCGSLYGVPHNADGDRIPDNNFVGQFCIHFTNSMTHGDDDSPAHVDTDSGKNGYFGHQSAIEYAYKNSQSGQK